MIFGFLKCVSREQLALIVLTFRSNFASLSSSVRRQLLDLLLRGIGNLTQAISKLITTDKVPHTRRALISHAHSQESLEPEEYSHRLLVHKNALKMYTFLLSWLISSLEKSSAAAAEIKPKGKVRLHRHAARRQRIWKSACDLLSAS